MKKAAALIISLLLCIGPAAGCRKNQGPAISGAELSGEIYSTGEFQAFVPEGWRVFPIADPFAEGRPVKTDCFFLSRGDGSERHASQKPYIRLAYFGPGKEPDNPAPDPALDRNVEEYPPMRFGDLVWNGYAADNYHGKARTGRFAMLRAQQDGRSYQAFVWFQSGGESVSLQDPDLQAILASLAPAEGAGDDTE